MWWHQISQNDFAWLGCDTSRSHQMIDAQYNTTIMGGREVSRPYRVWFFAEGERFLSFWQCHRPRWGGRRWWCGVADSSLGLKSDMPQHQRQVRSTGIAKRLFFMFLFLCPQFLSTELMPSVCFNTNTQCINASETYRRHIPTL